MPCLPLALLILAAAAAAEAAGDCDPGFADTCFTAVTSDLRYMLDLRKMTTTNVTAKAVHELCLALEDSLNCTSDIIDEDCVEGKFEFDSWLVALRGAHRYICKLDERRMTELLQGISCWSVQDFVLCMEEQAGLSHVQNLLHIKLDDQECATLHHAASKCLKSATVGSCREQSQVFTYAKGVLHAFFAASHCDSVKEKPLSGDGARPHLPPLLSTVASLLILLLM